MLHTIHKHKAACGSASEGKLWCAVDTSGSELLGVGGALQYCTFEHEPVDGVESTGLQTCWRGKQ